jgi:hypothetical protein
MKTGKLGFLGFTKFNYAATCFLLLSNKYPRIPTATEVKAPAINACLFVAKPSPKILLMFLKIMKLQTKMVN